MEIWLEPALGYHLMSQIPRSAAGRLRAEVENRSRSLDFWQKLGPTTRFPSTCGDLWQNGLGLPRALGGDAPG